MLVPALTSVSLVAVAAVREPSPFSRKRIDDGDETTTGCAGKTASFATKVVLLRSL